MSTKQKSRKSKSFQDATDSLVEHFQNIDRSLITAFENNKDDFLKLMTKIHQDMGSDFVTFSHAQSDEDLDLEDPSFEENYSSLTKNELQKISCMVVGTYFLAFLCRQTPDACNLIPLLQNSYEKGVLDGHAYAVMKQLSKH
jgi:hypothetical protein